MPFSSLGLISELASAVAEKGYTAPTPVQAQAIPLILSGRDLLAAARTGTGKTAAFVLPILQRLAAPSAAGTRALIISPTRELALQTQANILAYGKGMALKSAVVVGGAKADAQIRAVAGADIVVATPGRLLDLVVRRSFKLSTIEVLVLDEADRMLDMGFLPDITRVVRQISSHPQTLLFSATMPDAIKSLAKSVLRSPALLDLVGDQPAADKIEQFVYPVERQRKTELLTKLIKKENWWQALVFVRTRVDAEALAKHLSKNEIPAVAVHSDKSQFERGRALESFKTGDMQVLVATDLAARGLDLKDLPCVVNFDVPSQAEDYVHRVGRTARAGKAGKAVTLACPEEKNFLSRIESLLKAKLQRVVVRGFEVPVFTGRTFRASPMRKDDEGPKSKWRKGLDRKNQRGWTPEPEDKKKPRRGR